MQGRPDLLIAANVPPFNGTDSLLKVCLVDTQGVGAITTQHCEEFTSLHLQSSSAFVYCIQYGEAENAQNQEDYRAIARKDKSMLLTVIVGNRRRNL